MYFLYKFFYFIKNKFHFIWNIISHINSLLFYFLYPKIKLKVDSYFKCKEFINLIKDKNIRIKVLGINDLASLLSLLQKKENQSKFFQPFSFSVKKISEILSLPSFINIGLFKDEAMIGYFFLRLFINKKAFLGLMIDSNFRGKGFSNIMLKILYDISNNINFKLYSTIWKDNLNSYNVHNKNFILKKIYQTDLYWTFNIIGVNNDRFK
jgi:hypothetical protein